MGLANRVQIWSCGLVYPHLISSAAFRSGNLLVVWNQYVLFFPGVLVINTY